MTDEEVDAAFERFWRIYPRKVGKQAARKAFRAKVGAGVNLLEVSLGLQRWVNYWNRMDAPVSELPTPGVWMRTERWRSMLVVSRSKRPATKERGTP